MRKTYKGMHYSVIMLNQDTFVSLIRLVFHYFNVKIHVRYTDMNSLRGAKI